MALKRQVVLHNTKGSHNKYYEISIRNMVDLDPAYGKSPSYYYVEARWGRIENFQDGVPQQQIKGQELDWDEAMARLGDLMFSKLKKGYKTVKDTNSKSAFEAQGKATPHKPKKSIDKQIKEGIFDRTEHIEVAPSEWWKNVHENIEERVV